MTASLWQDPKFASYVVDRTSSRRWGEPEDLKGVALFLASRASDFVTGENIVVDGGVIGR
jgi:NAD(P)-dependent dehydrogenase (short-subunit alcohol dehydrogenase family)